MKRILTILSLTLIFSVCTPKESEAQVLDGGGTFATVCVDTFYTNDDDQFIRTHTCKTYMWVFWRWVLVLNNEEDFLVP